MCDQCNGHIIIDNMFPKNEINYLNIFTFFWSVGHNYVNENRKMFETF